MSRTSTWGRIRRIAVGLAVAVVVCQTASHPPAACWAAEHWTGFQGPPRLERSASEKLPRVWSPTQNIAWSVPLPGYGQSSPVIWDGRVFVTSVSGGMKENCHVAAFELASGEKLWQYDQAAASQAENNNYVSKAAPSPVVDADGLYVLFEGGNLLSLTHDGQLRWQRDLVKEYGPIDSRHGLAASLEQDDKQVFVWIERQTEPYLLAVAKATGETLWKAEGLGATSWASPRVVPVVGGDHLVLSGIGRLAGVDPATGRRLWLFDQIANNSTPTPIPVDNGRFLIGATEGRGEGGDAGGRGAAESNGLVQIERGEDGQFRARFVWRAEKATCSFGSPLAHAGLAYFVSRAGVVYCLDLATGEERYAERTAGSVWATPLAAGPHVYLFGRDGTTSVLKSAAEFTKVSENRLWDAERPEGTAGRPDAMGFGGPVLYAVAAAGDQLVLRRGDRLYCVRAAAEQ
ncbi:MAG: PQQ-binding-like beta-propeller repeat protein [Pirellulaceae bacterium]|nr:PQQ-binding-like beta-propeller repeat protein [Pirellulaceae bacterium]